MAAACCVVLCILAGALTAVPAAQAEPPDPKAQKQQLDAAIKASRADLHESYDVLQKTNAAYDQASTQYQVVQTRYARAQGQLAAARAADEVAATRLKAAEAALVTARAQVGAGQELIVKRKQLAGRAVRAAYQQQNTLVGLSIALRGASPADLATGMQVQRNVFGIQSNAISNLNDAQAQLANQQAKVTAAERAVSAQRAEAARTVQRVTALTRQVAADQAEAARVARAKLVAYNAAQTIRRAELAQYNNLVKERNRVQQILVARARAERAAAARRRAAAVAAEQARAKRENRRPRRVPDTDPGSSSSLRRPVNGPITSPYGQRFHPILKYWKLHDGTDFGAGCGTPIRAAASGVVTDRYYNGGYGNRVFISHGVIRGSALTTVYNHLSRYGVSSGQRVTRGEVIGYVGTTGYSTGCHLHFMVYQDGAVVNPMKWL
jgi:murein DD-endopeptidase MepM/ murein hydrolase activator NlpD